MGVDYRCGCRKSMDSWFLCKEHESRLMEDLTGSEEADEFDQADLSNEEKKLEEYKGLTSGSG